MVVVSLALELAQEDAQEGVLEAAIMVVRVAEAHAINLVVLLAPSNAKMLVKQVAPIHPIFN